MNEDAVEKFHHDRLKKHFRGVNEYRSGNVDAPFHGNLTAEYLDEQLDSVNYLEEMLKRGEITQAEFDYAGNKHFEVWNWKRTRE